MEVFSLSAASTADALCGKPHPRVSAFDPLPVEKVNLVYIDGGLVPGNAIGADAFLLEAKSPGDYAILLDKRKETVAFLRHALKARYRIGSGAMGTQTLFTRF